MFRTRRLSVSLRGGADGIGSVQGIYMPHAEPRQVLAAMSLGA